MCRLNWIGFAGLACVLVFFGCDAAVDDISIKLVKEHGASITSSSEYSGAKAIYAIDGDKETFWRPLTTDTNDGEVWLTIDFGKKVEFNRISLDMSGEAKHPQGLYLPKGYFIKVPAASNIKQTYGEDEEKWQTIMARSEDQFDEGKDAASFDAVRADRVTIVFYVEQDGTGTTPAPRLREMNVYNWKSKTDKSERIGSEISKHILDLEPSPVEIPFHKEDFHLYLFLGQSNMAGRAPIESQDKIVIERSYLFNENGEWEPAQPGIAKESDIQSMQGLNRYSSVELPNKFNGLNPAFTFAQTLTKTLPQIGIGIISNAKGGTYIREWEKGTQLYSEALRRVQEAMKFGTLKGIVWQQGESDRKNSNYVVQLSQLIEDFRSDLGMEDLPFFVGEAPKVPKEGDSEKMALTIQFNERLAQLPNLVPYVYVISSDGFDDIGDGTHIDAESQRIFGKRFAKQTLQAVYHIDVDELD